MKIEIIHSARKTVSLRIIAANTLLVRAPLHYPHHKIHEFVHAKERWITKAAVKWGEYSNSGALTHVTFLHRELRFALSHAQHIFIDNDTLWVPQNTDTKKLIIWMKQQARELFEVRLEYWSSHMKLPFHSWRLKENSTNWGSCSTRKNINLNWRLVQCDLNIIDYVIIHELAHLARMDHTPAFWSIVASHDADYAEHRAWLRTHSPALHQLKNTSTLDILRRT